MSIHFIRFKKKLTVFKARTVFFYPSLKTAQNIVFFYKYLYEKVYNVKLINYCFLLRKKTCCVTKKYSQIINTNLRKKN